MSRCIVPFLLALLLAAMTTTATAAPIVYGVNAHDNRPGYSMAQAEARFQLLAARNLRSYRFDVDPRDYATLDALVPLARKYGITLRPMVYPMSREIGYQLARRYAADIKVWEIGNEQDLVRAEADARIAAMTTMYLGMRQASNELGAGLRFTINITACNSDDRSANARCPGDRNGSLWFLAKAKAAGFNFDHISFHYYAFHQDAGYWSALYLGQLRTAAQTYKTPVFFNELNCAEIYTGNTTGGAEGDRGCYDSLAQLLRNVRDNYADVVSEVNVYELLDQTTIQGAEGHFGLMYDLTRPKPTLDLLTRFAQTPATATAADATGDRPQ
ncbi:hypothetical protein [Xanthomonas arboricola]|uniref:hypothetical protein n=1 Tax=Xanthomonas arboricola TaxID=56448 RepID=UPI0002E4DBDE|nr:hypothetical protein [Xanthomonas arboricola]MDN0243258.1 hypothetical protein [Xanthomonas arboricola pv. juglandis]MDN0253702.1 hypothetical protein [Xanthomonas arboricola pv. juglandis]MDN0259951.1 hypothetical protein [Xanthomonas arboricola pv. juglandis]MDN0263947.1 hypothetical protein [Xanthomonas arboricola pv. juglandis]MDN0277966.1 hypothetical protein [Xanthomonas arboricola pv. juglandis]